MYACVCFGVREREVRQEIEAGARSASEIFERLSLEPACGLCLEDIATLVETQIHALRPTG